MLKNYHFNWSYFFSSDYGKPLQCIAYQKKWCFFTLFKQPLTPPNPPNLDNFTINLGHFCPYRAFLCCQKAFRIKSCSYFFPSRLKPLKVIFSWRLQPPQTDSRISAPEQAPFCINQPQGKQPTWPETSRLMRGDLQSERRGRKGKWEERQKERELVFRGKAGRTNPLFLFFLKKGRTPTKRRKKKERQDAPPRRAGCWQHAGQQVRSLQISLAGEGAVHPLGLTTAGKKPLISLWGCLSSGDLPVATKWGNRGKKAEGREEGGGKSANKPGQGRTNPDVASLDFRTRTDGVIVVRMVLTMGGLIQTREGGETGGRRKLRRRRDRAPARGRRPRATELFTKLGEIWNVLEV